MEQMRTILLVNADEGLVKSLEEGLDGSAYRVDAPLSYLEAAEKLRSGRHDFVFVCISGKADVCQYLYDAKRNNPNIVAVTRIDPRSEVRWEVGNLAMQLRDYLKEQGASLVIGTDEITGEGACLPFCLDFMVMGIEKPDNP